MNTAISLRAFNIFSAAAAVALAAVGAYATVQYAGSTSVFVFFTFSFFGMLVLIAPKPGSYGYGFFAVFLFLGFWTKTLMHVIWGAPFLEAVGEFSSRIENWDHAMIVAACGALGVAVARCIHLIISRRIHRTNSSTAKSAPHWYVNYRLSIWILTIIAMAFVNIANYFYAFYKIGVNPLLILPLRLNIVASWLINIGFALWIVTLIFWELNRNSRVSSIVLQMPFVEALLSSASTTSRGIFVFHGLPYFIGLIVNRGGLRDKGLLRQVALILVLLLLISLSVVYWLRIPNLHGAEYLERPRSETISLFYYDIATEFPTLVTKRWTGLEGLLAVEGSTERGMDLFATVLIESPKSGIDSVFQKMAKVDFNRSDPTKTYLSNAGVLAILYMSDSLLLVFAGMLVTGFILILSDAIASRWTGNPLLVAVAGAGLANVIAQTNFPYLTAVFLLELWVTVGLLGWLERIAQPDPCN